MERKAIFLGDSITEGVGVSNESKTYWSLVGKALNLQVKHYGVSGTRIAPQLVEINKDWSESFIDRAKIMDKDADIVCVFGGTNDYGHGDLPIGKLGDTLPVTFYGALHTLFTYLYQTYPDSYIFFMTPLHRINENDPRGDGYKAAMLPLSGYVQAIREVAESFSLPIVDLYSMCGIQPAIEVLREKYMPDGLHPNELGHEKIAKLVTAHLKNFALMEL